MIGDDGLVLPAQNEESVRLLKNVVEAECA